MVLTHVDDVLVSSKCEGEISLSYQTAIKIQYLVKELEVPQKVLGYEVLRLGEGIGLFQNNYVRKSLEPFCAHKNANANSPFPRNLDLAHPESSGKL